MCLRVNTADDDIFYSFDDDDAADYAYYASNDFVEPANFTAAHTYILRHLVFRRRLKLYLSTNSAYTYTLSGRFVRMFGLDPSESHVITNGSYLSIEIPYDGLTYITLNSNLTRDHLVCAPNKRVQTSSLTSIIPAPGIPGDPIYYTNTGSSGKLGVTQPRIDYIDLLFSDEKGAPLYSLENYVVTFVIDWILPTSFPGEDRYTLDQARVNKKIRIK
jgi:hypothetical protein